MGTAKVLFVLLINPIFFEVFALTPSRLMARSLTSNHPSTSFLIVATFLTAKQSFGRFVVGLIDDKKWVVVAAVSSASWEVLLRVTLKSRDRLVYRLFSVRLPDTVDTTVLQSTSRNDKLRGHNSMYETMSEVISIWTACLFIISWDIDVSDGRLTRQERFE